MSSAAAPALTCSWRTGARACEGRWVVITALILCVGEGRCALPRWQLHGILGPPRPSARIGTEMGFVDAYAALAGWMHRVCADLAGCYENPVRYPVRLGWFVVLPVHVGRPYPMVTTGLSRIDFLNLTIVNGARPGSRRMIPGLQPPMAEGTGSRHARSSFHPSSRLARSSFHCG